MPGWGDFPGGNYATTATDTSADGSVVVGTGNLVSNTEAFRWTALGGMVGLGDMKPGLSINSQGEGVSADGSVVVGVAESTAFNNEAFRWTAAGGMVGLGMPSSAYMESHALGVSADGSVVVGYAITAGFDYSAVIWDAPHGMRTLRDVLVGYGLDLNGVQLLTAEAISDDGFTIIGEGINPSGLSDSWIATIPEPSVLWFVALAPLIVSRRRVNRS